MTIRRKPIHIHVIDLSLNQDSFPRFKRDFGPEHETAYVNGFTDALPDPGTSGMAVLTGSEYSITDDHPWLGRLEEHVRKICGRGEPLLGICYGHQLIARALAGPQAVGRAAAPEVTYTPIEIVTPHPVFDGLPNPFLAMSAHYDEVKRLPEGFETLARSKDCAIQAMAHRTFPIVGVQFHPEFEIEKARQCITGEREKLARLGFDPGELLARVPARRTGAEALLLNFARYAAVISH